MIFGGIQKNSLIDYPGKVSCVLFLKGCNFDCPYCHNPDLVKNDCLGSFYIDEQTAFEFLEEQKGFLDGVVISGGEPSIHKDLPSLCREIRKIGYPIKLDTNGSKPQMIKQLIDEGLVYYVAMDIKTDPFHYSPLITKNYNPHDIISSIRIIIGSDITHEFRTTCVKPFVDVRIIREIAKYIEGAPLYTLQRFHNNGVLHPEFFLGISAGYDETELLNLQSIAEPWVEKCVVIF